MEGGSGGAGSLGVHESFYHETLQEIISRYHKRQTSIIMKQTSITMKSTYIYKYLYIYVYIYTVVFVSLTHPAHSRILV